ncbi:hypothetical protein BC834DRAFT_905073 [Gloeopeniophorella convolvens]|nr:hypothetical protein BC834DRAFT_905073 [Gloeopeniophorella convolvens]
MRGYAKPGLGRRYGPQRVALASCLTAHIENSSTCQYVPKRHGSTIEVPYGHVCCKEAQRLLQQLILVEMRREGFNFLTSKSSYKPFLLLCAFVLADHDSRRACTLQCPSKAVLGSVCAT